ncbi:MBL fold metallo-hydrolase [Allobranchiibius sp. GilTou73]|uniref:MBL fold metallo-hydrolase n=1 Tax=Allobranchiibius sp. GilTou73 TaxID=2904523 RepID=UPI001F4050F0|nr:MBL fold metallo-hydrolase [Allobranchiibius sp. GilTou73]UIJ35407.1 MBL fold metallo-hydrolase [Allobranchiibius sp. GilTou73]
MRLTILGGGGAYPTPERPCSGYLVEQDGFRLLVDPGHGTMSRLVEYVAPEDVDAALVTHGHADHCADLNPLLRARHLADDPPAALPIHAPSGALGPLLGLDGPMLVDDWTLTDLVPGQEAVIGPFTVAPVELPHFVTNLAIRLSVGGRLLAYTGDAGASPQAVDLARGADVLLAEASFVDEVPEESADGLSSARDRGALAAGAGVGRLVLCHVWPGMSPNRLEHAARREFSGEIAVATPGLTIEV